MKCGNCLVCDLNDNINCPHQIIDQFGLLEYPTPEPRSKGPRFYNQEQKEKVWHHSDVKETHHDKNLGSEIKAEGSSKKIKRLAKVNRREKFHGKGSLPYAISFIKVAVSQLQLPNSLFPRAVRLFKRVTKKGQKLEATALASLSLASEEMRVPVSSGELAEFGADKGEISKVKRKIIRELDLNTAPLRAEDFVNKICSKLDVPEWSSEVRELISDMNTIGKNPEAVVGGAVWHISKNNGHKVERNEIAEACNVTDVTIQNNAKKLS